MHKKIIALAVAIAILCGVTVVSASNVSFASSNDISGCPSQSILSVADNKKIAKNNFTIEKSDKLVTENAEFELYLEEKSLIIKVRNKKTGYIWCSAAKSDMANTMSGEWKRVSQSLLVVDYIAKNGTEKRSPLNSPKAKKPKVEYIDNGFKATVNFFEAKVTLDIIVALEGNVLRVNIPDEAIILPKEEILSKITVMPFLGAVYKNDIPGYHFIPDGSGATMNFSDSQKFKSSYKQRVYGKDNAVSSINNTKNIDKVAPISSVQMAVFGSVHGEEQNAYAAIITGGDAYCEINASPAGVIVDYSWIAPSFIYNELYFQSTGGTSGGFNAVQSKPNKVDAQMEYHFLDYEQADYIGIANEYKAMLIENNSNLKRNNAVSNIPIKIDALMAEPKKSFLVESIQIMTTVDDVSNWTDELATLGADNLIMSLVGFNKGGKSGHKLGEFSLEKKVGKKNEIVALSDKLNAINSKLYLQTNFQSGYEHQLPKTAFKFGMNANPISIYEQKPLYTSKVYADNEYMAKISSTFMEKAVVKNIALDSLVSELHSDFTRNNEILRSDSMDSIKKTIEQIENTATGLMMQSPNAYATSVVNVDAVYDMPLSNSGFTYFTNSVPFLQTVYSGYIDCFSKYQNFTTNTTADVLKLIEYNTYPSYILTEEYSNKLANTNMNGVYSSRFNDWKPYIIENYKKVNEILSKVSGAQIIDRHVVQDGVSTTQYDNGITIIVNYLEKDVMVNGNNVLAMSAVAVGKED